MTIYYTGVGANKNGKHTVDEFIAIMNKHFSVEFSKTAFLEKHTEITSPAYNEGKCSGSILNTTLDATNPRLTIISIDTELFLCRHHLVHIMMALCVQVGCARKRDGEKVMCLKHDFQQNVTQSGKKTCSNLFRRSCFEVMDADLTNAQCGKCRDKANTVEVKNRQKAKVETVAEGHKRCTKCLKVYTIDLFVGERADVTLHCASCRGHQKRADSDRDLAHRNALARVATQKRKAENDVVL